MEQSRMVFMVVIVCLLEHFCLGIPGDKGLVLGVWNPASFTTYTEIPTGSSSSFDNVSLTLLPSNVQITSMTSDPKESVIFASIKDAIYIYHNFSIWQNASSEFSIQFRGKSAAVGQIAFDFVSNNLYWCDSLLNWIAMKPAYNFNNTIYKVVVHKNLNEPEGLALDPLDRLMFFSDNEPNSRLEKASLDGQNRVVIVHNGLSRVISLTVDMARNKLYWVDYDRQTLESCDYDGTNRRVIRRINSVLMTGLTYYQNTLHVVSSKSMFGVDTTSGSVLYSRKFLSEQPFAILAYDAENPGSFNNPCSSFSCEHMCVNIQTGPKCVCSEGFQLNGDATTCNDRSWFFERGFIVSNASIFVMHEVHSTSGQSNVYHYLQVSGDIIETFAVDSNSNIIYYVDSRSGSLKKLDVISQQASTIASIASAKDMMFDWIANLLGWIETSTSSIRSFSVNSQTNVAIYSNLQQPTSLTVNPHDGVLYWISGISVKSIFRGSWTRETPVTLISSANLNSPSSLQYDVTSNRLYWLDITILKSSLTNGTDIKSHIITGGATELFVYKDFYGWIYGNNINFARKTATRVEDVLNTAENSIDVAVFDSFLQSDKRGTCDILNGGCDEICVPEENVRRCECDVGLQLQQDQTCDSDVFLSNFLVVSDFTHGRILQVDLQNGTVVKLPVSLSRAPGLAIDKSRRMLFYSEMSSNTIISSTLHGKNVTLLYATGFAHADRLAIDYSTGNLYYTAVGSSTSQSYIGVVHRSTHLHKTLINNLHNPRDIALYPSKGYLFWTEFGNITEIGRTNMDGTAKIYIATTEIGWPNGLTIDFTSNRLYWTDGLRNRIESSDLNGGNRQILATDSDAHLMSIVNHGQYLFYTAWNRQRITKMDKFTGSKVAFMSNHQEFGRLDSLDIYADESQDVSLTCLSKNGFCSTFCFPTPSDRTCGCQDNVNLQSDQLTCQGVSPCPTLQPNLNFLNCPPYPGQSCDFECKIGYRIAINTSVFCGSSGQWDLPTETLCEAILCPVTLGSAQLSTNCGRRIGDSCSFSCTDGYRPSTSTNLMCTTEGTWNVDTNTLCTPILCPVTLGSALVQTNCSRRIGDSCSFSCTDGYRPSTSTNLTCTADGTWNVDTNSLCSPILCPVSSGNAVLSTNCSRRIGDSCSFSCTDGYRPTSSTSLVCTSEGTWNVDTSTLCSPILCPVSSGSTILSTNCGRRIGDSCSFSCTDGYRPTTSTSLVCTADGTWNVDTNTLCTPLLCPVSSGSVLLSTNCSRRIGDSCSFSCTDGYRPSTSTNLMCTADGTWNVDTFTLCSPILCPVTLGSAVLQTNCSRRIGDSCSFSCTDGYRPSTSTNLTCTADGTWNVDTFTLCSPILCPVSSSSAVLSTNCSRRIGDSCSFSCTDGYRPTTSTNLVCTSEGTWNVDTNTLCSPIRCPETSSSTILSTNCSRKIGDSCSFSCTDGYRPTTSTSLVCTTTGMWNLDINTLCSSSQCSKSLENGQFINCQYSNGESCRYECNDPFEVNPSVKNVTCKADGDWSHDRNELCVKLCSPNIRNGQLEANCQRNIGNSCLFTCDNNYKSSIVSKRIICTTEGVWNENTGILCQLITCPKEVVNGNLSSSCRGMIGEKCDVICEIDALIKTAPIVCLSSGVWNKDTAVVCSELFELENKAPAEQTKNTDSPFLYAGLSVACVVVVVVIAVIGIYSMRKRQDNSARSPYEDHPLQRESSVYTTFENGGYDDYSSIEDIDDPYKSPYLTPVVINSSQ